MFNCETESFYKDLNRRWDASKARWRGSASRCATARHTAPVPPIKKGCLHLCVYGAGVLAQEKGTRPMEADETPSQLISARTPTQ